MNDPQLKHEIITELRAGQSRSARNATALVGLALLVGCTVALNPLVGGIVAGALMFVIAVTGMIMSRKRPNDKRKEEGHV